MKARFSLALIAGLIFSPVTLAANSTGSIEDKLTEQLVDKLNVDVVSMEKAPIEGLYQAVTKQGMLYISEDGSKLIHGNIYALDNNMENLSDTAFNAAMAAPRLEMLKPFEKDMLVYKAKNEKYVVTVFTDVDCGYCRKLHNEMQGYNDLGITIRYLAYPRRGVPSANADEMQAVWCAKDPLKAMTEAKSGGNVKAASCDVDISKQFYLGQQFGISGTPAIVLENGSVIPGYQPPERLLKTLQRAL
ncbi:bifunctional protein-disulfide isomerase/oxidoreductase DsbC [Shewanella sp. WXL01]|uniref:bifunctional protein-disulfide isomerase/oxidoreductase DsbC n=1 Tax=Shewanella sp. WXL01 TaxID=2709721 RepID=UPI00143828E4|nr:bifunctional protein-disulfide isomerase/oxidoreductase DsbC [Shewanella sp. WXL01]NKF51428.1 bifunctional protein-disulfide isomerase/oxidoreductase DsbC [Shewanella sp. WXL01]